MKITLPVSTGGYYPLAPTKIIALGLNYLDHIHESQSVDKGNIPGEIPKEPVLFPKTPNVLVGPDQPVILPSFLQNIPEARTDYEAELALLIKDRVKNVAPEDALTHIFGFTCFNDISQRNLQKGEKAGWFRGKSLDTFGPIGPVIVPSEQIDDPQNLDITCRLNGKIVQQSNTKHMLFSIAEIISFISKNFTLEAGDIIVTGTPSGVGPIQHGDVVEVEIEKIGILSNSVIKE